jgi:hypothetical protein
MRETIDASSPTIDVDTAGATAKKHDAFGPRQVAHGFKSRYMTMYITSKDYIASSQMRR